MKKNRSIPKARVIPGAGVGGGRGGSVGVAVRCVRIYAADFHGNAIARQLSVAEDGAIILTERTAGGKKFPSHSVLIRVEDADAHAKHAIKKGAKIVRPAMDYPFGERQYTAEDFAGNRWTFSQTIADVAPEAWGGKTKKS